METATAREPAAALASPWGVDAIKGGGAMAQPLLPSDQDDGGRAAMVMMRGGKEPPSAAQLADDGSGEPAGRGTGMQRGRAGGFFWVDGSRLRACFRVRWSEPRHRSGRRATAP
jgi:hypothetical protein